MLADSMYRCMRRYRLDADMNTLLDGLCFTWLLEDGSLYATAEYIAETGTLTLKKFGCEGHAHVFGKVLVEFIEGPEAAVTLTDCGATAN